MQNVSEWLIRGNSEVLDFLLWSSGFSVVRLLMHQTVEQDDKECSSIKSFFQEQNRLM